MKELVQVVQSHCRLLTHRFVSILCRRERHVLDRSFAICRGPPTIDRKDSASTLHGGPISDDLTS